MLDRLGPGVKLYGYCNGYFSRESFGERTIIASGSWNNENYIVAEDEGGGLTFASGFDLETAYQWLEDEDTVDYG